MVAPQRTGDSAGKQRRMLHERALAAAKGGDWEAALLINQELLRAAPDQTEVHNRLGRALAKLGRLEEAHAAYSRAIEIEPHNNIAHRNLRRLDSLKDHPDERFQGQPLVRSSFFIEETGKTAAVSLARPTERSVWRHLMPGDPLELRIDEASGIVSAYSSDGIFLGEIEPRIGERIVELSRGGNRYAAAVLDHEEDTLRVMLREVFQDPDLSDRLSFPTRVRGAAPRAYIRKDILFDADEADLIVDADDEEAEEAEEEPEIEDEEFSDDDLDDSQI